MSGPSSSQIADDESAALPAAARPRPMPVRVRRIARWALAEYPVVVLTLAYFAIAVPLVPDLLEWSNLRNVFSNMLPLLAIAVGQTIVLIAGGIDLSITSILALTSVVGACVMSGDRGVLAESPFAVPAAVAAMLAVGGLVGLCNGLAVTILRMPAFIVTLTTMMSLNAVAIWITRQSIGKLPAGFLAIGSGGIGWIPCAFLIAGGVAAIAHIVLSRTVAGWWIYAIGQNPRTARVAGVPVKRVIVATYIISGLCAAIGSTIYTARNRGGVPTLGGEMLLDIVGAVVIGGASLLGGRGNILGTLFGVLLFCLIANTLNLLGLQPFTIMMTKGLIILIAAGLDLLRVRLSAGGHS